MVDLNDMTLNGAPRLSRFSDDGGVCTTNFWLPTMKMALLSEEDDESESPPPVAIIKTSSRVPIWRSGFELQSDFDTTTPPAKIIGAAKLHGSRGGGGVLKATVIGLVLGGLGCDGEPGGGGYGRWIQAPAVGKQRQRW
ncbi:hypothetical protein Hdeb2414_s0010g00349921 [Helianthus debilis subsp. tardiflorus]